MKKGSLFMKHRVHKRLTCKMLQRDAFLKAQIA